jgi:LuxR family maltose regulon positive regulatory protein
MNLWPLQALALHGLGREGEALQVIGPCLALAAQEGFIRIFLDKGAPMVELLQVAMSQGIETEYVKRLLIAIGIPITSIPTEAPAHSKIRSRIPVADLLEPLSERELKVLRLLRTHLTIKEISQELFVAPSTIRTHVRNIYSKLGVHYRIEAIRKAGQLSLI